MRSGGRMNERIILPALEKFLRIRQHLRFVLIVWRWKINKRFPQYAAHACLFSLFRDGVFEVVHVRKSGYAPANLLCRGQTRAPADKFFSNVFGFRGENIFV